MIWFSPKFFLQDVISQRNERLPQGVSFWRNLAAVLCAKDDTDGAEAAFRTVLRLAPDDFAADDSVQPQTVEAINHARAAGVPMIVAINKIDRPGADAQKVRTELLQHEVLVEAMSGEVLDVECSAITGEGLDKLVEAIVLQTELLDLKANPDRAAEGAVIEAKLDVGRGPVATVLVQRGTLKLGDIFVVGEQWGRVRALIDETGERVEEAGPSVPIEVLGLQGTPEAGDTLNVVEDEAKAREIADSSGRGLRQLPLCP